ncbi:MAG: hypothetical protein M1838_004058 [Thelocarpon superellum]|nr:MAG: hypothetical protein M1838_004058 [Thelocarpon superellum]
MAEASHRSADEAAQASPVVDGDDRRLGASAPPVNGQSAPPYSNGQAVASPADVSQDVDRVLHSEIGVNTLLTRLKQSIASARDFATFLKKRSILEEEQAQGIKKLCRVTFENIRRPEHRQGSYSKQFIDVTRIHDRMAENGLQFALSLHQLNEELQEMATIGERGRKHWKQAGLTAEKRVQDAEVAMEKAKGRYDSLAKDYERARTGDRQPGKMFGLTGPKSAAQYEEDLHRKLGTADADYAAKVQAAQGLRQELLNSLRPQAVRALQDLVLECDSALTMQLQKYATANEKLLLNNGLSVSPLNSVENGQAQPIKSLRDVIYQIDNERDLDNYVASFAAKVSVRAGDIKYERHPSLAPQQQHPPSAARQIPSYAEQAPPPQAPLSTQPLQQAPFQTHPGQNGVPYPGSHPVGDPFNAAASSQAYSSGENGHGPSPYQSSMPPQIPVQFSQPPQLPVQFPQQSHSSVPGSSVELNAAAPPTAESFPTGTFGVPLEELFARDQSAVPIIVYTCIKAIDVFGLGSEGIYRVPGNASDINKLKAKFQAVEFKVGADFIEDINNVAGLLKSFFRELNPPLLMNPLPDEGFSENPSSAEVYDRYKTIFGDALRALRLTLEHKLKTFANSDSRGAFDRDERLNDANVYGELLRLRDVKQDEELYREMVKVAGTEEERKRRDKDTEVRNVLAELVETHDIQVRDEVHKLINNLQDPNYATIRVFALHLSRVMENGAKTRMDPANLATVLAPTLMEFKDESAQGMNMAEPSLQSRLQAHRDESGWQVRFVQTILEHTHQIFNEDDDPAEVEAAPAAATPATAAPAQQPAKPSQTYG